MIDLTTRKKQPQKLKKTILSFFLVMGWLNTVNGMELPSFKDFMEVRPDYDVETILKEHHDVVKEGKKHLNDFDNLSLSAKREFVLKALNNLKRVADFVHQIQYGSITSERYTYLHWDAENDSFNGDFVEVGIEAPTKKSESDNFAFVLTWHLISQSEENLKNILTDILNNAMIRAMEIKLLHEGGYPAFIPFDNEFIEKESHPYLILKLFHAQKTYIDMKRKLYTNFIYNDDKIDMKMIPIAVTDAFKKIKLKFNKPDLINEIKKIRNIVKRKIPFYLDNMTRIKLEHDDMRTTFRTMNSWTTTIESNISKKEAFQSLLFSETSLAPLLNNFDRIDLRKCLMLLLNRNAKFETIGHQVQKTIIAYAEEKHGAKNLLQELENITKQKARPQKMQIISQQEKERNDRKDLLRRRLEAQKMSKLQNKLTKTTPPIVPELPPLQQTPVRQIQDSVKVQKAITKKPSKSKKKKQQRIKKEPDTTKKVVVKEIPNTQGSLKPLPEFKTARDDRQQIKVVAPVQAKLMQPFTPTPKKKTSNHIPFTQNTEDQKPKESYLGCNKTPQFSTQSYSRPQPYKPQPRATSKSSATPPMKTQETRIKPPQKTIPNKTQPISSLDPINYPKISWANVVTGELPQTHDQKDLSPTETQVTPIITNENNKRSSSDSPFMIENQEINISDTKPEVQNEFSPLVPIYYPSCTATQPQMNWTIAVPVPTILDETILYDNGCFYPVTTDILIPNSETTPVSQIVIQGILNTTTVHVYHHATESTSSSIIASPKDMANIKKTAKQSNTKMEKEKRRWSF